MTDAPKITLRRSMRSEIQPIGYCRTSAPANSIATNRAIWAAVIPISVPKTAPMPDCVAYTLPRRKMPIVPSGDPERTDRAGAWAA